MKLISKNIYPALLLSLVAGCASIGTPSTHEDALGKREQKAILARAKPLSDYGFVPSFPYGNRLIYFGATRLSPDQTETLSFAKKNLPIIAIPDGFHKKLTLLLNPAASVSMMEYSAADKYDVSFLQLNKDVISYIGDSGSEGINTCAGVIPHLQIGQIELKNTPFYIRMAKGTFMPDIYSTTPPRVDAVLGYDNLRQFEYIQFNLKAGTVQLSTSTPYEPNQNLLMSKTPISPICRDRLAVDGSIFGQATPIILDFAGDYSFALNNPRGSNLKQVSLGDVVFVNVPTEALPPKEVVPCAGRKLLEKYVITVCPRAGVVYFERPAK